MTEARVGLVGCGLWGRHILRDLRALGCEVPVVARSPASVERARAGGAVLVVPRPEDLPAVDGCVVATPTSTHAPVVDALLPRNVPVFVEKALTSSVADARRIAAAAGDRVFVMDKWRYHPGIEELARIARSGTLGEPVGLRTVRVGWRSRTRDVDVTWYLPPHDLAIALEIFGHVPAPRAAVAERVRGHTEGLVGLCGTSPWLAFEVSETRRRHFREVRLFCTEGTAVLDNSYADAVLVSRGRPGSSAPPEPERRPIPTELPLLRELRCFVEHLRGGPPPRSSAAEGVAVVEAVARLRELAGIDGVL